MLEKIIGYYKIPNDKIGETKMKDTFVRKYSPLHDDQKRDMDWIKHKAEELESAIETPSYADPRLIAMAKSYLEIAVMLAVKGVANPKDVEPS